MELADRILNNDPELQHLYLSSDTTHVPELAQALTTCNNHHLQHVYFRNFKLGQELFSLLQAVSSLPNLHCIFFHCSEVPLSLLARMLSLEHTKLTALGLRYCKLKYETERECQDFERALRRNTTLQDVCVECCEWQVEEQEQPLQRNYSLNKMSSFLQAISQIPSLRHVECVLAPQQPHHQQQQQQPQRFPTKTLTSLCQIPLLQTLRLRHVWLPQSDVALVCHTLTSRQQLTKLILSLDMGPTSALALGHLLQSTPSLEHLALRIDRLEDVDSPQLLAHALHQQDCHLQHFHLSGEAAADMSLRAKRAFRDTLQTNIGLEFVRLDVSDYALQSELAFYLQLNHKGRRALFGKLLQTCREDDETQLWVQALCQNASDVRALHYFLALHPSLFATAALEALAKKQDTLEQQELPGQPQSSSLYEWDAEDGIVYDSDGW